MNPPINNPVELVFDQLRDILSMEVQLCKSLPELVELCTNDGLWDLIASHAIQNSHQIAEITAIFKRHGRSPGNDLCKAMAGLIEGGTAHLNAVQSPPIRDLMMIAHCLRIEYYEMAAYEFTTLLSGRVGLDRESEILSELLAEEKKMTASLMMMEPQIFDIAHSSA